jgi:hypothetical protein
MSSYRIRRLTDHDRAGAETVLKQRTGFLGRTGSVLAIDGGDLDLSKTLYVPSRPQLCQSIEHCVWLL